MSHATQPLINSILKYLQNSNKCNHSVTNEVEIICNMAENRTPKNTYCLIIYRLSRDVSQGNLKVKRQRGKYGETFPKLDSSSNHTTKNQGFQSSIVFIISRTSPDYYSQNPPFSTVRTRIRFHGTTNDTHLNLCLNHMFVWDATVIGHYVHP